MKLKLSFFIIAIICCSSCAQLSLFQDAKTNGKGKGNIGGYVSAYGILGDESIFGEDIEALTLPYFLVHGGYGVTEKLDLQLSLSSTVSAMFSTKYQALGDPTSKWAFAVNPGIEWQIGPDIENERSGITRLHLASIVSFHPSKVVSIFAEPRHITQYRFDQDNDRFFGANIGVNYSVSEITEIVLGGSYFDVRNTNEGLYQLVFGINLNIGK